VFDLADALALALRECRRRGSALVACFLRDAHGAVVNSDFTRDALKGDAFMGYLSAPEPRQLRRPPKKKPWSSTLEKVSV
jgi:hypothetical protein